MELEQTVNLNYIKLDEIDKKIDNVIEKCEDITVGSCEGTSSALNSINTKVTNIDTKTNNISNNVDSLIQNVNNISSDLTTMESTLRGTEEVNLTGIYQNVMAANNNLSLNLNSTLIAISGIMGEDLVDLTTLKGENDVSLTDINNSINNIPNNDYSENLTNITTTANENNTILTSLDTELKSMDNKVSNIDNNINTIHNDILSNSVVLNDIHEIVQNFNNSSNIVPPAVDNFGITPVDFDETELDIDSTTWSSEDSISFNIGNVYSYTFYSPPCAFRKASEAVNIIINIKSDFELQTNLTVKLYLNDKTYNTYTLNSNDFTINLSNFPLEKTGNIFSFGIFGLSSTNTLRINSVTYTIQGQNIEITSRQNKFLINRICDMLFITKMEDNKAYMHRQVYEKINNNIDFEYLHQVGNRISVVPVFESNQYNGLYTTYHFMALGFGKDNKVFHKDTYAVIKDFLIDTNFANCDSTQALERYYWDVCIGASRWGDNFRYAVYSYFNANGYRDPLTNFMNEIANASPVKNFELPSTTRTAKFVARKSDGTIHFICGRTNTAPSLFIGYGKNITANYQSDTIVEVYYKYMESMIKCEIDITDQTAPVLISKKTIGSYDYYFKMPTGYYFVKDDNITYIKEN